MRQIALAAGVDDHVAKIAPLIYPAKLATLAPRGANQRVQKITAHLADAKAAGVSMANVCDAALKKVGMTNTAAAAQRVRRKS